MKHHTTLLTALLLAALALPAAAAPLPITLPDDRIPVDTAAMARDGSLLTVSIELHLGDIDVRSREAYVLTPRVVSQDGQDSIVLPSVGIYGRRRYYYLQRNTRQGNLTGPTETSLRTSDVPDDYSYRTTTPWRDWMRNSRLLLHGQPYSCCNCPGQGQDTLLAWQEEYIPTFNYVTPHNVQATAKARSLSGSALITFPVNQTVIRPDYRDNTRELDKIATTINTVKFDADMTITAITLKGYASPEGSYKSNERLARGRVEALEAYISRVYGIDESLISTDYEAENWQDLRDYVAQSPLAHRDDILRIIDNDDRDDPDAREARIRRQYPDDYRHLLLNCYPALRRTDYRVDYVIRSYTDADEIRRLIQTDPGRLSLQEFYLAAQGLDEGSEEYDRVFDVAVRLFPDDETCNLNVALAHLRRGDLDGAQPFLRKAGHSPEAEHAREVYLRMLEERQ